MPRDIVEMDEKDIAEAIRVWAADKYTKKVDDISFSYDASQSSNPLDSGSGVSARVTLGKQIVDEQR